MDYKHAYLNTLLLLHSTLKLSLVKMLLKGQVSGHAVNSHGNIVNLGNLWKNHGIELLNFCGNPAFPQLAYSGLEPVASSYVHTAIQ